MSERTNTRPLSPHLQVYRLQRTFFSMSIFHRMTGMGNAIGLLLFSWWLIAAATGPDAYEIFIEFIKSGLGRLMMFGWTVSVFYHLFNGIRHLIWDAGYLLSLKGSNRAGYVVFGATALAVVSVWGAILL